MAHIIQHLAKQYKGKNIYSIRECGRRDGSQGGTRVLSFERFQELMNTRPEECCKTCANRYHTLALQAAKK